MLWYSYWIFRKVNNQGMNLGKLYWLTKLNEASSFWGYTTPTPKLHTCNCVQICTSKPSLKTGNSVSHHSLHVHSPSVVNFLVLQLPSSYVSLIWHQPKPINFRMFQGTKISLKITIKIHLHCSNIQKQNTDTLPKFNSRPPEKVTVPKAKRF